MNWFLQIFAWFEAILYMTHGYIRRTVTSSVTLLCSVLHYRVQCLGRRRLSDMVTDEETDDDNEEVETVDSRYVTLIIICILCTLLFIIITYQSFKLCKVAFRWVNGQTGSFIIQYSNTVMNYNTVQSRVLSDVK